MSTASNSALKISVVMVSYNSAATIGPAIESFVCQTHPHKELIIVDGASRDRTRGIIDGFRGPGVVIVSEPDRGIYDAMNKGLGLFSGDAVGFLNSDNRFTDNGALAAIADGLARSDIVYGDLDFVKDHASREVTRRWRSTPYQRGSFRRGWMPPHPTVYCRRRVVERVGKFDLAYEVASDYDYMVRAFELSDFSARPVDRVLVDMLHGGRSTAGVRAYIRHNLEALASRRKWLGAGIVDYATFAKPLRKMSQFIAG
jgi:glycosyltransferase